MTNLRKNKGKKGCFMLKMDLEKDFNHLEGSFVYRTLLYFKFPPNITKLIMHCISISNIASLINGSQTNYFALVREIHQGDPMSPYTFILVWNCFQSYITSS